MILLIFTDGAARGNPGPAGCGVVIVDEDGTVIEKHHQYIGEATNNIAEYKALILGLTEVQKFKKVTEIRCYADSKLIVEQVNGNFKVKNKALAELHEQVRSLVFELPSVQFFYIPREKNKEADKLANIAINQKR
jgi:ribonuclease HI